MIPTMFLSLFLFVPPSGLVQLTPFSHPFSIYYLTLPMMFLRVCFTVISVQDYLASLAFVVFHDVMACTRGSLILTQDSPLN